MSWRKGLLYHAYKSDDPTRTREWNLAIRTLRRGDHYLLVLWDTAPPSDHPTRDFLKPVGVGVLIAVGIFIAIVLSEEYNISLDRFRKYLPAPNPRLALIIFVGLFVLALLVLLCYKYHNRLLQQNGQQESCERRILAN